MRSSDVPGIVWTVALLVISYFVEEYFVDKTWSAYALVIMGVFLTGLKATLTISERKLVDKIEDGILSMDETESIHSPIADSRGTARKILMG